ncbi:hypothetical protein ppKF707_5385 [Metapseudomonas furukawaii]|uniref:Uncharacterized protein n=1 Tax=Metapseudomonas furukawaii TaxID=1149133 RepID=A0AAD1FI29_METFU|nr:hypothetical protein ppKF707_5385 [Pseudomonas furukawaii]BAU77321.1 hypothetical protein KF707C_56330 [Pseudomonas furukawaii]
MVVQEKSCSNFAERIELTRLGAIIAPLASGRRAQWRIIWATI